MAICLLVSSLYGCNSPAPIGPAEAQASGLPAKVMMAAYSTPRIDKAALGQNEEKEGINKTMALYRVVYCAEKKGDAFLVDEALAGAYQTRRSWEATLSNLANQALKDPTGVGSKWAEISHMPCH
jgi:hypothetical protein